MKVFKEQYEKLKSLPEWPPKDEYDLYYSHRMLWRAALKWAVKAGEDGNCGRCYTEAIIKEELEE